MGGAPDDFVVFVEEFLFLGKRNCQGDVFAVGYRVNDRLDGGELACLFADELRLLDRPLYSLGEVGEVVKADEAPAAFDQGADVAADGGGLPRRFQLFAAVGDVAALALLKAGFDIVGAIFFKCLG